MASRTIQEGSKTTYFHRLFYLLQHAVVGGSEIKRRVRNVHEKPNLMNIEIWQQIFFSI